LGRPCLPQLYYIVPYANWVVDWVGHYITTEISRQFGWRASVTPTPHLLFDQIVHYGELGSFLYNLETRRNRHNNIIATVYHGTRGTVNPHLTEQINLLIENISQPVRIVTACQIMKHRLVEWGASSDRVICIPLGVDLSLFKPSSVQHRMTVRRRYGIPDDAYCIGSFQKDGAGWGEGLIPKLIKGPDIFLKVVERLHQDYKLFVLLTGPARGYVKLGLEAIGVPYRHEFLSDYRNISRFYHCLDLYLVASREEGGPIAVLESLASGVPLVSTSVGLAPDIIKQGQNGLLADSEDIDSLAEYASRIIEQPDLRYQMTQNGLETIKAFDWKQIGCRYYQEVYRPVLNELGY
jgi:glycosyltransferase involved in cell wall biosynthesis